jgi:hypothetical protein
MTYAPPAGFTFDPQSGKYYRYEAIVDGQQWVTWFDANSGQYEQVSYPAAPVKAPTPSTAQPVPTKKRGKGALVALIALAVIIGGVFGGHYLGFYSLPFLTDSVNTVSVLETKGTVDIERSSDTLAARVGMRLMNLDTVRTGGASSAWLSLDSDKAIGLAELTALRVDQSARGFELTLVAGEIRAQIDKPLTDGEDFTVQAGNLALAVRGTVFTANYARGIVSVMVESGTVAVLDAQGREMAVLNAGESGAYETGETVEEEAALPTPSSELGQPSDDSGAESSSRGWSAVNPSWDTETGIFDGTGSASIWHESLALTQADITDVVVYIDGAPHPISITQFNESNEYGEGKFYGIFFDEFFTVWPATYTLSYKVQGVEVSPAECLSVVVHADGTHEYVVPSN